VVHFFGREVDVVNMDRRQVALQQGSVLGVLSLLALKAKALHLAHRTSEALEAIKESYNRKLWMRS
jgi:hypothetical protein